jgi:hypothetical protein
MPGSAVLGPSNPPTRTFGVSYAYGTPSSPSPRLLSPAAPPFHPVAASFSRYKQLRWADSEDDNDDDSARSTFADVVRCTPSPPIPSLVCTRSALPRRRQSRYVLRHRSAAATAVLNRPRGGAADCRSSSSASRSAGVMTGADHLLPDLVGSALGVRPTAASQCTSTSGRGCPTPLRTSLVVGTSPCLTVTAGVRSYLAKLRDPHRGPRRLARI